MSHRLNISNKMYSSNQINEITIDHSLPTLFIEYATILKLRAELELKNNSDNSNLTLEYVQFVRAIDNLILNYKVEILRHSRFLFL